MNYRVHLYPKVRVVVDVVGAESQEQALEAACDLFADDADSYLNGTHWDEGQIDDALVDEEGDSTYERSQAWGHTGVHWEPA